MFLGEPAQLNMGVLQNSFNGKSNKLSSLNNLSNGTHAAEANGQMSKTIEQQRQRDTEDIPEETIDYLKHLSDPKYQPKDFDKWSHKEQHDYFTNGILERLKDYPKSLSHFPLSFMRPGDCGRPLSEIPDWLDMEKLKRGQKFAMDNYFGLMVGFVFSILGLYTFQKDVKPIIFTGKSSTPFASFRRYRNVAIDVRNWYQSNFWTEGTTAYETMVKVRKQHMNVKNTLSKMSKEEIDKATTMTKAWCPMQNLLREDFQSCCPAVSADIRLLPIIENGTELSQASMSMTQYTAVGLVVTQPEFVSIHSATDEDLDAFCHLWRGIGYQLGIEDEYNFCNGSLEEIRQRVRDITEFWIKPNFREITPEWEHVTRCLYEGSSYYTYDFPYESILLYYTDLLQLPMLRLRAALNFRQWFIYKLIRLYSLYLSKLPGVVYLVNKVMLYLLSRTYKLSPEKNAQLQEKSRKVLEGNVGTK